MDVELEKNWKHVLSKLSEQFGEELDMQGILFLIGVQELGKGYRQFSKDQKVDLMHVAICKLLSQYGYYEYQGRDEDGWPHWKTEEKLPHLKPGQQLHLVKQAITTYFSEETGSAFSKKENNE